MKILLHLKKTFTFVACFLLLGSTLMYAQPVSVVSSGGISTYALYNNLKHAFDSINTGYQTGAIDIMITGNCTETATANLDSSGRVYAWGTSSYTSITIKPVGGAWMISGAITAGNPLINLNGADNVTINGVNGLYDSLTISNTTVSATSGTCTIRFINDAGNNTITNTTVTGAPTMTTTTNGGVIFFSTSVTNGNSNNTISNCLIGNSDASPSNFPYKLIFLNGTTSPAQRSNKGITITGNRLVNFRTNAVYINTGNDNITVSANHLFHTSTVPSNSTVVYGPVYVSNTSGTGFNIKDNYIGGSQPFCGGAKDTVAVTGTTTTGMFHCIYVNAATSGYSYINGNTINNSVLQSASTTVAPINGLIVIQGGRVMCGSQSPNILGNFNDTGALITNYIGTGLGHISGIEIGSGTLDTVFIENNIIGGITSQSLTAGQASLRFLFVCQTASTGKFFIRNNIIGNPAVPNSLKSINNHNTKVFGFRHENSGTSFTHQFSGNVFSNISNYSNVASNGNICGFSSATANTSYNIDSNVFQNFNNYAPTNLNDPPGIAGIYIKTPGITPTFKIRNNIFRNFTQIDASAKAKVIGIDLWSGATASTEISGNRFYSLNATTATDTATIAGIRMNTGSTSGSFTISNNEISLGKDSTDTDVTLGHIIYGIQHLSGNAKYYHNSINISGQNVDPKGNSYAFYTESGITATLDVRNNIFSNQRSFLYYPASPRNVTVSFGGTVNSGTITGLTCNYNLYYANGTATVPVVNSGVAYSSLLSWKSYATSHDVNSMEGNPMFYSYRILSGVSGSAAFSGDLTVGITKDISGALRTSYLVGAYDMLNVLPVSLLQLNGKKINEDVLLKWSTASEINNKGFEIQRSVDRVSFIPVGFAKGNGTSNIWNEYIFSDNNAFQKSAGVLYYRLKQVDYDGQYSYSKVIAVNGSETQIDPLVFYPNPFESSFIVMNPEEIKSGSTQIRIIDIAGNEIFNREFTISDNDLQIDMGSAAKGFYFISVTTDGKTRVGKICKN